MLTKKTILVVGGAGYIGSHMVHALGEQGYQVIVLDNLSKGYADAVLHGELIVGDMGDAALLQRIFTRHTIDAVMHFASFIEVGESVQQPAKYYENNVAKTLTLLQAMQAHDVSTFIFSSTAAVYGVPQYTPIDLLHPKAPINPYGHSKWMVEQMLQDFDRAYGLKSAVLRYFNAAGAHPDGILGERHEPESHLIPLVLQAASGRRKNIKIYGEDYPTDDGSCVRDYIHVSDLCEAHLLALQSLFADTDSFSLNLGTGEGYSVKELIAAAKKITGKNFTVIISERRLGDPPTLVADVKAANTMLNWQAQRGLNDIIADAWAWELNLCESNRCEGMK
ncbi:MAG: UDP-glucose 4-epimerase GalE [marine bacterium B5-7]|nr:MAG: UDP-glucose 4-epimerase GalE [marine bacterium B5-7]